MSSSLFNSSIPISISDDDSGELGRMRVRARRKRKKRSRVKNDLAQKAIVWLSRYWMIIVFLTAAAGLLVFEASRIGGKPKSAENSEVEKMKKAIDKRDLENNLDRFDPPRCLKLLPAEELDYLEIPGEESDSPVKKLVYISEKDRPSEERSSILYWQQKNGTRFNLFTGNQSFDEREKSFKVDETACVHCGFYSDSGGFRISEKDKSYMEDCKVVVSTCAFGGGDALYQPIGMSKASLQKVCYVAFWDEITLAAQESERVKITQDGFIGKWRIVIVQDLPFVDQRLNGKIPKMLPHRLFPQARYSIWVDSKSQFRRDPLGVLEALLWRTNSALAISEHGARSRVYDEARAVVTKNKAKPEEVREQLSQYRFDGLPEDKRLNGKKALSEASIIVREHTPLTNLFMCLWFNEAVRFTSRDQLSFPYVLWRLKALKNINVFPVCTRKDLVNNIGHIRKAKPLIS